MSDLKMYPHSVWFAEGHHCVGSVLSGYVLFYHLELPWLLLHRSGDLHTCSMCSGLHCNSLTAFCALVMTRLWSQIMSGLRLVAFQKLTGSSGGIWTSGWIEAQSLWFWLLPFFTLFLEMLTLWSYFCSFLDSPSSFFSPCISLGIYIVTAFHNILEGWASSCQQQVFQKISANLISYYYYYYHFSLVHIVLHNLHIPKFKTRNKVSKLRLSSSL